MRPHHHVPDATPMSYEKGKYYAGTTLCSGLPSKIKVSHHNRNTFTPTLKRYPLILLHCRWIFFQLKICSVAWLLRNGGHKYLATFLVCIIWFAHI